MLNQTTITDKLLIKINITDNVDFYRLPHFRLLPLILQDNLSLNDNFARSTFYDIYIEQIFARTGQNTLVKLDIEKIERIAARQYNIFCGTLNLIEEYGYRIGYVEQGITLHV